MIRVISLAAALLFSIPVLAETVLITGSNRGIGFELAKQFAERGWDVIATSRSPEDDFALHELDRKHENLVIKYLDVTDHAGIDALAAELSGTPIDILLNNAATGGGVLTDRFGELNYDPAWTVFNVNAVGPLKVSEAFVDHVAASERKLILTLNGEGGSLGSTRSGSYMFGGSKAALNMYMLKLAFDLKDRGITVTVVTPGFVDTMGFADGTFDPEAQPDFVWLYNAYKSGASTPAATPDAVARLIPLILSVNPEHNGQWLNLAGEEVPW